MQAYYDRSSVIPGPAGVMNGQFSFPTPLLCVCRPLSLAFDSSICVGKTLRSTILRRSMELPLSAYVGACTAVVSL
jgi:hypothetical protein